MNAVPFPPGKRPPNAPDYQLHNLIGTHQEGDRVIPAANAIRIDNFPNNAPDVVGRLIPLLRWITWQWWVDRDRRHDQPYRRNVFTVTPAGELVGGVGVQNVIAGRFNIEEHLTEPRYWLACELAISGKTAPQAAMSLLDSIYFLTTHDLRRSVLDAGIACEMLMLDYGNQVVARGLASKKQMRAVTREARFILNLRDLTSVLGRSFADDEPEDFRHLDRLWKAKHKVAHGKAPLVIERGRCREMNYADQVRCIEAVMNLVLWFQAIGYTLQPAEAPRFS